MDQPVLWYFADPMCSWCWGFSPVIEAIRQDYRPRMKIALILGGLRPGTTDPMSPEQRKEILHHWQQVEQMTGRTFCFEGALPEGFVYDTEPPSRAVVAMADLEPESVFPMFKAIQSAFYTEGRDVTRTEVLAELAERLGADRTSFQEAFGSDTAHSKTLAHFQMARRLGVRGFPSLVLQAASAFHPITSGWRPLEDLRREIDARLG